jgi:hypothetical protein
MRSSSATFQALTISRRESGLVRICSTTCEIWSIFRPSGAGQRTPLHAVHRAQLSLLVGPLVPDGDLVFPQEADIRLAPQKPQQLVE